MSVLALKKLGDEDDDSSERKAVSAASEQRRLSSAKLHPQNRTVLSTWHLKSHWTIELLFIQENFIWYHIVSKPWIFCPAKPDGEIKVIYLAISSESRPILNTFTYLALVKGLQLFTLSVAFHYDNVMPLSDWALRAQSCACGDWSLWWTHYLLSQMQNTQPFTLRHRQYNIKNWSSNSALTWS